MSERLIDKEIEKFLLDFKKYAKKINEMMVVSLEGDCPQIFKIMLMNHLSSDYLKNSKKVDKKMYKQAEKLYDKISQALKMEIRRSKVI